MSLMKGSASISRWRILDPLTPEFTPEFISERLRKFAFADIENAPDESSCGWAELFDEFAWGFEPGSFQYGTNYAFAMRLDSRRLSGKILSRYLKIQELKVLEDTGRRPGARKRREMKEALRLELLRRTLLQTDVYEAVWFTKSSEVWLFGAGEKLRSLFEDLFGQTFGLAIRLIVPITLALELTSPEARGELLSLQPCFFAPEDDS